MTLADAYGAFVIIGIVVGATLCTELVSYMIVYSTDNFKRACDRVVQLNKQLAKEDAKIVSVEKRRKHEKVIESIEDDLKSAAQRMDAIKFKGSIVTGIVFFFLYRMVAAAWMGEVVARLPFLPIKVVQSLSFRGLTGDDTYNCSFGLIYTLCTIGIKANIPKALGFTSPKSAFNASRMAARQQRKSD